MLGAAALHTTLDRKEPMPLKMALALLASCAGVALAAFAPDSAAGGETRPTARTGDSSPASHPGGLSQADSIGDGGPATEAVLVAPEGVAVDGAGNIYVSERAGHRVRRVDARSGLIATFAGTGRRESSGDGGPAAAAGVALPTDLALDAAGNLYIAEPAANRVRRVDAATGRIETFAGTGERGFSGDGGPAAEAALNAPFGVSVDGRGDVYIADTDNQRIRRVDAETGVIRTVAGNGEWGFAGDDGPATDASLARPHRTVVDAEGHLFIGDSFNHRIRRVDAATGVIRTIAGTGRMGASGDGGPATEATLTYSGGLALDGAGGLVYTDLASHRIRRIDLTTGVIATVAGSGRWDFGGDGGPALEAHFHLPGAIVVTPAGDLVFADKWNGRVRRVESGTGRVHTVAGSRPSEPTADVSYHFHYDADELRRELDAPVAFSVDAPADGRTLEVAVEGRPAPLRLRLHAPADPPPEGGRPLVLLIHGRANHEFDPLDWGGLESWGRLLAARGFAAAVLSHRLGQGPGSLEAGVADVTTALGALRAGADTLGLDADRIALFSFAGGSALLADYLEDPPPFVRCLAAFSPHTALEPPALWDWYEEKAETRERHAPARRVGPRSPPLFLAVGEGDRDAITAPFADFVAAARAEGIAVEVARHPTGGADFERLVHDEESREIVQRALRFLEGRLRAALGG